MVFARWQRSIVDDQGNIIQSPNIEVRRKVAGAPLASLYSDRDGANSIGNPFIAGVDGFAAFHVTGGPYRIRAYKDSFERVWDWVGIGTSSETDFGTLFVPRGAWNPAVTYELGDLVSDENGSGGEPYAFVSNADGNLNHPPQFDGSVGASDTNWTVVGLIESPGAPGSSDVVGSSVSSVAIGSGAKVFTVVESDRGWGVGSRLRLSSNASPITHWMEGIVTGYSGNTLNITVDLFAGSGSRADWTINLAGEQGEDGSDPGILLTWDTGTADADPGAGKIRANNASLASATQIFVSKTNRGGSDIASFLLSLDDSTTTDKGLFSLTDPNIDAQTTFRVTGITDASGYVKVAVSSHTGATSYANLLPVSLQFYRTGDKGADGTGTVNSVNSVAPISGNVSLAAADIPNTPAGNIAAINVQAAINELDTEKQPIDSDLTALANNGTNGLWSRTGAGTGAARTITNAGGMTIANGDGVSGNPTIRPTAIPIGIACSDESTALTAGTGKATFRMPYAFTVTGVRASLTTAQASGSIFTVDINEAGASILSTKLTIDNTEKTSTTAATPPVISDTSLADDAEITIDIDQIGDGTAKGLKVWLIGYPT